MNNALMSVTIQSLNEQFDREGIKICYGLLEFCFYSKDGVTPTQMNYRAKGAPAVKLAEAGVGATGTAIGFIDYQTIDKGEYKDKLTSLVIRKFVVTTPTTPTAPTSPAILPTTDPELVTVGAASTNGTNNGYLAANDDDDDDRSRDIPF